MTAPTQIVSSQIAWALPQSDGTINIREQFTDDQRNVYFTDYTAPSNKYDTATRLANDAANLTQQLIVPPVDLNAEAANLQQQIATLQNQLQSVQVQLSTQGAQV